MTIRKWLGFGLAWSMIAATSALPANGGVVRGRVNVPPSVGQALPKLNPYPGRAGTLPAGAIAPRLGAVQDAVVFVEKVPADLATPTLPAPKPTLEQKDQAFTPRVLAVRVGTRVDFPNQDRMYHNVFSVSPVKRFDLGKYSRGHSKAVTFDRPGIVNVFCDIHSDMAAFVYVLPHHVFAQPSADGEFSLPNLPAGTYTLKVWHPDLGERTREIKVPEGRDLAVEIEY